MLSPYEDHRLSADARTKDLLNKMTMAEKVGVMMHGTAQSIGPLGVMGVGAEYNQHANQQLISEHKINHLITRLDNKPKSLLSKTTPCNRLLLTRVLVYL